MAITVPVRILLSGRGFFYILSKPAGATGLAGQRRMKNAVEKEFEWN